MKTTSIQSIESTPSEHSGAKFIIWRKGQQAPSQGNGVEVEGKILLPAKGGYINPELRFERHVSILGQPLLGYWGLLISEDGYRYKSQVFTAEKWGQAFDLAVETFASEIAKLDQAIIQRKEALAKAEEE